MDNTRVLLFFRKAPFPTPMYLVSKGGRRAFHARSGRESLFYHSINGLQPSGQGFQLTMIWDAKLQLIMCGFPLFVYEFLDEAVP